MAQARRSDRSDAVAFGLRGEALAAWCLRLKGYRVLARRSKHHVGEIDLIARRGSILAFVEVKARVDAGAAIEAITHNQRRRIERAAQAYMARTAAVAACQPRFDVVLVAGRGFGGFWPRHIADAWRPEA